MIGAHWWNDAWWQPAIATGLIGIANHSWSRPAPATPEGEVVSWADRIAYVCHDWEDAVLAGIVAPGRGEVLYDGERFTRARLDLRRRLNFIPDFPALFAHLTVIEQIALLLRVYEHDTPESEERILHVLGELDMLPLAESRVGGLSRGQIYKVALAALATMSPALWLLDEPFASGLDPQGLAMLKQYVRAAAQAGSTTFYSTQILDVAEKFCDLLVVVDHGQRRATYTRAELAALPPQGPDSLEMKLRQFREPTA